MTISNLIKETSSLDLIGADRVHTMDLDFDRKTIQLFVELARCEIASAVPTLKREEALQLTRIALFFDCPTVLANARVAYRNSGSPCHKLKIAAEEGDDPDLIKEALATIYRNTRTDDQPSDKIFMSDFCKEVHLLPAR